MILKKAQNNQAYLKCGIYGFAGSGKTFTASLIAIGLAGLTKTKSVAFFDSETGSDFVLPRFKEAKLDLLTHKGRAFVDLLAVIRECEKEGVSILIIDSISHVWKELQTSFKKKLNRKSGFYFHDWDEIKTVWQEFTDLFVNSKIHIIMCGRAGNMYETTKNDETGKTEMINTGSKMKVEGEIAFEPSLLIEMVRDQNKDGHGWVNTAIIEKDRWNVINGLTIPNPGFSSIRPHVDKLNLGGTHVGVGVDSSSEEIFEDPRHYAEEKRQHAIALERLEDTLTLLNLRGTAQETTKKRILAMNSIFGVSGKTQIEGLPTETIFSGIEKLKQQAATW